MITLTISNRRSQKTRVPTFAISSHYKGSSNLYIKNNFIDLLHDRALPIEDFIELIYSIFSARK